MSESDEVTTRGRASAGVLPGSAGVTTLLALAALGAGQTAQGAEPGGQEPTAPETSCPADQGEVAAATSPVPAECEPAEVDPEEAERAGSDPVPQEAPPAPPAEPQQAPQDGDPEPAPDEEPEPADADSGPRPATGGGTRGGDREEPDGGSRESRDADGSGGITASTAPANGHSRQDRRRQSAAAPISAPQPHAASSAPVAAGSQIPSFLVPIYRACGSRYGIPWRILAAINQVETAFGTNLGVSSAGATGWMQFMPGTWQAYGVDADRDGRRDPYAPRDAICSAANYLRASGGRHDMRRALFAYNHAGWYVDMVLALARQYAGLRLLDPLPRSRRLDRDFARSLARTARAGGVDWALAVAVLRARGERGRVPASQAEVRALVERLGAERARSPRALIRSAFRRRNGFVGQVAVLANYNRAVGLRGLVEGLHASHERLGKRVLGSEHLTIYAGGRQDIASGRIDVRILTLLLYLAEIHDDVAVTSLTSGHSYYARPGVPSAHSFGRAVDIAAIDGSAILGNQRPGGITERAVRGILALPAELRPAQVISLFELGGPSFAAADHHDHIHVGY